MKHQIKSIAKSRHTRELVIYGLTGIVALIVQDLIYLVMHHISEIKPSVSIFIGNVCGFVISYIGHTKFTFQKERFSKLELIKTFVTSLIGLAINVCGVYLVVNILHLNPNYGLIPTFISPIVTFLISKFWAFK